jgi:polyisoprenoid-binding protein YceI
MSMQSIIKISILFISFCFASCMREGEHQENNIETNEETEMVLDTINSIETGMYIIKQESSKVEWKGERITGEFHKGTIDIKSGNVKISESNIIGGEIALDMRSMLELNPESEETTIVVMGYLQSERFFNTDKFPNAVLTIKGEKGNKLWCDLTIRNVKKEILVPYTKSMSNDTLKTNANFKIDRTDWGIDFRSAKNYKDIGLMAIKDSIGFKTSILAIKKSNL